MGMFILGLIFVGKKGDKLINNFIKGKDNIHLYYYIWIST